MQSTDFASVKDIVLKIYYELFDLACVKTLNDDYNKTIKYFNELLSKIKELNEQEKEYCKLRLSRNIERNKERDKCGKPITCKYCHSMRHSKRYCENCIRKHLRSEFGKWTSNDESVDEFIQNNQLQASVPPFILEWIPPEQFEDRRYLSEGGFSKIYYAKWKRGPIMDWNEEKQGFTYEGTIDVALKFLNNSSKNFYDEVNNYFKIRSGNLVKYYGITKFPESNNYVMVMNYYKEGNLRNYLENHRLQISLRDKIYFIYRICFALYRIHSKNFVHRDLHSANILLFTNRCLIADLGLCRSAENILLTDTVYGVLPYTAPELHVHRQYSKASDIYSLGMLMWEIFAEYPPFNDQPHDTDLLFSIIEGNRPPMLPKIPDTFKELIPRCWDNDAGKRPGIEEIYKIVVNEFINVYEKYYDENNGLSIWEYENKCGNESLLEVPKPHSVYPTENMEDFIIKSSSWRTFTNISSSSSCCPSQCDIKSSNDTSYAHEPEKPLVVSNDKESMTAKILKKVQSIKTQLIQLIQSVFLYF